MEDDLLVFGTHKMVHDVRGRCVATGVAEPFGTYQTLDNRSRRVNSAVAVIGFVTLVRNTLSSATEDLRTCMHAAAIPQRSRL